MRGEAASSSARPARHAAAAGCAGRAARADLPGGARGRYTHAVLRTTFALPALLVAACSAPALAADAFGAGEIADARVILELRPPARPGFVPEALPPRFVLMDDGRVFVGGHAGLASVRLDKSELKALDKRLQQLKRMPGIGTSVSFGPGDTRYRLRVPKERIDVLATGDPARAPIEVRVLSALVADLAAFDHAGLQPLVPAQYLATAREETLAGGCRAWGSWPAMDEIAAEARVVPSEAVVGWPTGAVAASVCEGGRHYALTLRPLLPGERP